VVQRITRQRHQGKEMARMLSTINETVTALYIRFKDEKGQALAEYGLIVALIAVVCIAILGTLGLAISGKLGEIATELGAAGGS
jgi:pilus assembly protein Flp/PilA